MLKAGFLTSAAGTVASGVKEAGSKDIFGTAGSTTCHVAVETSDTLVDAEYEETVVVFCG